MAFSFARGMNDGRDLLRPPQRSGAEGGRACPDQKRASLH
jgi:hypothetical protein